MGLLAPPEPMKAKALTFTRRAESAADKTRQWPSYEKSLAGAPPSDDGSGPDRSRADFWWCYLALQRRGETVRRHTPFPTGCIRNRLPVGRSRPAHDD
jgi:hypothetical protein